MTQSESANDNSKGRRVRDGLLRKWAEADLAEIATDESLVRLADARNDSSASANKFMLLGALAAFLYLLRLEGVAGDLKLGDYSISDLPFGLFVTSVVALVLATVALIRIGDARGFDRQLRLACERRYASGCHARYAIFPNAKAFGESFSLTASVVKAGTFMSLFRFIALMLSSLFILFLIVAPALAGIDYLANGRYLQEGAYENIRFWLVALLVLIDLLILMLVLWMRFIDEG